MGHGGHDMKGFLGPYGMSREGSGTSWQPDTSPHEGIHAQYGDWMTMWHALFNNREARAAIPSFVSGMVMAMAERQVEASTFGLRAMLSPDPFMGASGYPVLLATGETGRTAGTHWSTASIRMICSWNWRRPIHFNSQDIQRVSLRGLPGDRALQGPSAFMHRTSGPDNPETRITHHWLLVCTWRYYRGRCSRYRQAGRAFPRPRARSTSLRHRDCDSYSGAQAGTRPGSFRCKSPGGTFTSPEHFVPMVDENRVTASLSYTKPFNEGDLWATTLANEIQLAGHVLDVR